MLTKIKKTVTALVVAGGTGYVGYDQYDLTHERKFIGYDEKLVVRDHVDASKRQFMAQSFQKSGLTYEEIMYFHIQKYDPNLLQKAADAVLAFVASVDLPGCAPKGEPPGIPGQPPVPPTPPPTTGPSDKVDWSYDKMAVGPANKVTTGEGMVVAVVDTGADITHPDLKNQVVKVLNCTKEGRGPQDVTDQVGHGTHVSGIILAAQNGEGIRGVASGAKLVILKGLGLQGGTNEDLANCLGQAIALNVDAINMSWGGGGRSQLIEQRLLQAAQKGIGLFMAAGNDSGPVNNPAKVAPLINQQFPGTAFAVQATDKSDELAFFSSRGPEVTVGAPGVKIYSTLPLAGSEMGKAYGYSDGTSMATPNALAVYVLAKSQKKVVKTEGKNKRVNAEMSVL